MSPVKNPYCAETTRPTAEEIVISQKRSMSVAAATAKTVTTQTTTKIQIRSSLERSQSNIGGTPPGFTRAYSKVLDLRGCDRGWRPAPPACDHVYAGDEGSSTRRSKTT